MVVRSRRLDGTLQLFGMILWVTCTGCGEVQISVDADTSFQIMGQPVGPNGQRYGIWEAASFVGPTDDPAFANYVGDVLDLAVNELGIDRVRLEIRSGSENPQDSWTDYRNGLIDNATWRSVRYATVDDNGDPFVIDWAGFHFSELDDKIDNVILPLQQKLAAVGKPLLINLNYVCFNRQIVAPLDYHHTRDPEEYAEFVLATYLHMQGKYGFVPDTWEVILEPEITTTAGGQWPKWSASHIAEAIAAAGDRLKASGFTPRFVAPSKNSAADTDTWVQKIAAQPGALPYLTEISYHLYGGNNIANRQAIAAVADRYQLNTAQLEAMYATYHDLHKDLKDANNSAWSRYTFRDYIDIDLRDSQNPVARLNAQARFMRQYMKFVRAGAKRVRVHSSHHRFDPVAFVNADGTYVVVVNTLSGGTLLFTGLPRGRYAVSYTTACASGGRSTNQTVTASNTLRASIPEAGVLTVCQIPTSERREALQP